MLDLVSLLDQLNMTMMKTQLNCYIYSAHRHRWASSRLSFVRISFEKLCRIMFTPLEETTRRIRDNRRVSSYSVSSAGCSERVFYSSSSFCSAFSNEHSQRLLVDDHHRAGDEQAKKFEEMLRKSIASSSTISPKDLNLSSNSIDYIYIQLAAIITSFYHRLNVPLRVCLSPSYELLAYESLRLTIEVYLPSQIDYVRVGSVSLIDDYLARRLMIKHNSDEKSYVAMIHARVADVSQLSKCILEASQTIGRGIKLPSALSMR